MGTFRDHEKVNTQLRRAEESMHLITPFTAIGSLPEGFAVSFTMLRVNPKVGAYEVPGARGQFALLKSSLERIAAGAGVSFDPFASGRTDDGSSPHYCRWTATGSYRGSDSQPVAITKSKEVDFRDGADEILSMRLAAEARGESADAQIRMARRHIQALAESKAQNRVIRSLGLQASYRWADFEKPFVMVKLAFTGESDDPELRQKLALLNAQQFLSRPLYGGAPMLSAGAPPAHLQKHAPPPVGQRIDEDDVGDDDDMPSGSYVETTGEPVDERSPFDDEPAAQAKRSGATLPRVKSGERNVPIEDARLDDLIYWQGRFAYDLHDSRNPERDRKRLDAVNAEIKRREAGGPY